MLLLVIVGGATASPVAASDGDRPLLPQDMNSTVLAGEATTGEAAAPLCADPVPGWKDSFKEGCKAYEDKKYCTSTGAQGSGWTPSWGAFARYAMNGVLRVRREGGDCVQLQLRRLRHVQHTA